MTNFFSKVYHHLRGANASAGSTSGRAATDQPRTRMSALATLCNCFSRKTLRAGRPQAAPSEARRSSAAIGLVDDWKSAPVHFHDGRSDATHAVQVTPPEVSRKATSEDLRAERWPPVYRSLKDIRADPEVFKQYSSYVKGFFLAENLKFIQLYEEFEATKSPDVLEEMITHYIGNDGLNLTASLKRNLLAIWNAGGRASCRNDDLWSRSLQEARREAEKLLGNPQQLKEFRRYVHDELGYKFDEADASVSKPATSVMNISEARD